MLLRDALDEFWLFKSLEPTTADNYARNLAALLRWLDEHGVTEVDELDAPLLRRYVRDLQTTPTPRTGKPLASSSVVTHYLTLTTFLTFLVAEYKLDPTIPARLQAPKLDRKVIQTLTPAQVDALFNACGAQDSRKLAARDRAILAVLFDTGCRASELTALRLEDVHMSAEDCYVVIRRGKGGKGREAGLGQRARKELSRYLRFRRVESPWLFVSRDGCQLHRVSLDKMLYRLRDRAGIEGVRVSAHTARHTFSVRYMEQPTADVLKLGRLLGHSRLSSTEHYVATFGSHQARLTSASVLDAL